MAPQEQRVLNPPVVTILSSDSKAADREVVLSYLFKAIQLKKNVNIQLLPPDLYIW